jgi:allophanate hydrolase subunit 1
MKKVEDMVEAATRLIDNDELSKLRELVGSYNQLQMKLGEFEVQKAGLLNAIFGIKGDLEKFQEELKDKYGDIIIDIQTGEFKDNPNESNS